MYTMGTLLQHGNVEQKKRYLPRIATGELRLQAFGVTEPNAGSGINPDSDDGRLAKAITMSSTARRFLSLGCFNRT